MYPRAVRWFLDGKLVIEGGHVRVKGNDAQLLISIALSLAATAAAAAPPQRVEIAYELARNGSVLADIHQRLEHDGRSYRLTETWKGKGLLCAARRSGALQPRRRRRRRPAPAEYEDRRSGRDTQRADIRSREQNPDAAAAGPAELHLEFRFRAAGRGRRDGRRHDGKSTTTYVFQAAGRERVKTPAGEFDALKLVKRRDNPQDKATEIWLAADRQYIPVRILIVDKDGTRLDQVARENRRAAQ